MLIPVDEIAIGGTLNDCPLVVLLLATPLLALVEKTAELQQLPPFQAPSVCVVGVIPDTVVVSAPAFPEASASIFEVSNV